MQKQITSIPGYQVHEYLLVLQPHEELQAQIGRIKKEFADKYRAPQALHTKPHLALVNFFGYQMTEDRILNRIGLTAMGVVPFKIELSNFGSFPSHTIYATVTTKMAVQNLVKELKAAQTLMTLSKDHKPHFIEDPHFTICRKLKPWQYEQAWLEYSHRNFAARFVAGSLTLLKRLAAEKGFRAIGRFELQGLATGTKQGILFNPPSTGRSM